MATRTFLFVDQVGSTEQLTRLGDAGALELRTALPDLLRQAVSDAGGREVDSAGDGLFCAFDGAGDGVDAAVAMQQLTWSFNARRPAGRHLSVRVGLHTGEPLENADGGYFGAAVVVASRLCSTAGADQILTSDLVRALVEPRGSHVFEPVGVRELKGVPEPVAVTSVRWEPPPRRSLPGELDAASSAPFVGRARELATLEATWRAVLDGTRRTVAVSGDHGMGTTHLVAEFARSTLERGATVLAGDARRGGRMGAWADAVTTWTASLARAELRIALGQRADDLDRLVPGLAASPSGQRSAAAGADPFVIADALDEVLSRAGGVEPVIIVLDHTEEADDDTLTVLRRLATSKRAGRLLLVACYEPSEVGTPRVLSLLASLPGVADVRLGGLGAGEVAELMEATTGQAPAPDRVRAVLAESEGSPYFVISMAVAQRERDLTGRVADAARRAEGLRTDLRLQREEITLGLRQLEQLRSSDVAAVAALVEADGTPPADVPCPYKGLLSFGVEDAGDFHGRESLVAELTARLMASRFLGVVGPSGSGKSSVVTAGLLPALAGGAVSGSEQWQPVVLTPGADALASLAGGLHAMSPVTDAGVLARRLAAEPLGAVAASVSDGRRLVLVVDQGEELWTSSSPASRDRVIELLTGAVHDPAQDVVVVLVLRADYYGRAAAHPELAALLTDSQVLVGPLSPSQVRAVVEAPARRAGLVLEPGLSQAVIDDAGDAPGALPLVSTALLETWQRRRGRSLTLAGYAEAGGVRRAIAHLADATYQELGEQDRPAAQRLLLRLAAPGVDGDDVARRASLAEVTSDDASRRVLDLFIGRRLVTVGADTVQVAHEALLREWPRLRTWLDADRDGRRLHQRVASAATEWDAGGRDDDALLRGARLAAAADLEADRPGDMTGLEREYLAASVDARRRALLAVGQSARRRRTLVVGLVGVVVIALLAGTFAATQRRAASQRATESLARGLAAQAAQRASSDDRTALLLAVEAQRRDDSIDTRVGLSSALAGARYVSRSIDTLPADMEEAAVAPGGRKVWITTGNGRVVAYDTTTWRPIGGAVVKGPGGVTDSFVNRRRDRIAVATADGFRVYDLASGQQIGPLLVGDGIGLPSSFTFSDDGGTSALVNSDTPVVILRNVSTGALEGTVNEDQGPVLVSDRPGTDEYLVAPFGGSGVVRRVDVHGAVQGADITLSMDGLDAMAVSPDSKRFIACGGSTCEMRDVDSGALEGAPFKLEGSQAYSITWNTAGTRAAIDSDDGSILVVATSDPAHLTMATLLGISGGSNFSWIDDYRLLAWSSTKPQHVVYDMRLRSGLSGSPVKRDKIGSLERLGDDSVWESIKDGVARVDVDRSGTLRRGERVTIPDFHPQPGGLTATRDGRWLALFSADYDDGPDGVISGDDVLQREKVAIVDSRDMRLRRTITLTLSHENDELVSLALSPDGRQLAVGRADGSLLRYRVATGKQISAPRQVDIANVHVLTYTPDGNTIVEGGQDGVLHFLDAASGKRRGQLVLSPFEDLNDLAVIKGSSKVAVSSQSGDVFIVDLSTHRQVGPTLTAGGTQLIDVAASPGGVQIAAIGSDGSITTWDRASGRTLGPVLPAVDGYPAALAYLGPGGRELVAWQAHDGTRIILPVTSQALSRRACQLAGRNFTRAEWKQYLPGQPYRQTCPRVVKTGTAA